MIEENMITDVVELMKQKVEGYQESNSEQLGRDAWDRDTALELMDFLGKEKTDHLKYFLEHLQAPISLNKLYSSLGERGILGIQMNVRTRAYDALWGKWDHMDIPKLQIRWNRFLSWFRGYSFQVSGDMAGGGDYGSSATTLRFDLRVAPLLPQKLKPLIAMGHIAQATSGYDDFFKKISMDPYVFDTFMKATNKAEDISCGSYNFAEFMQNFSTSSDINQLPETLRVVLYQKTNKVIGDNMAFSILSFGKSHVAFSYLDTQRKWAVLEFPEYNHDEDADWEYHASAEKYYSTIWKQAAWILLMLEGVTANYIHVYPKQRSGITHLPKDKFQLPHACEMGTVEQLLEKKAKELFSEPEVSGRMDMF